MKSKYPLKGLISVGGIVTLTQGYHLAMIAKVVKKG